MAWRRRFLAQVMEATAKVDQEFAPFSPAAAAGTMTTAARTMTPQDKMVAPGGQKTAATATALEQPVPQSPARATAFLTTAMAHEPTVTSSKTKTQTTLVDDKMHDTQQKQQQQQAYSPTTPEPHCGPANSTAAVRTTFEAPSSSLAPSSSSAAADSTPLLLYNGTSSVNDNSHHNHNGHPAQYASDAATIQQADETTANRGMDAIPRKKLMSVPLKVFLLTTGMPRHEWDEALQLILMYGAKQLHQHIIGGGSPGGGRGSEGCATSMSCLRDLRHFVLTAPSLPVSPAGFDTNCRTVAHTTSTSLPLTRAGDLQRDRDYADAPVSSIDGDTGSLAQVNNAQKQQQKAVNKYASFAPSGEQCATAECMRRRSPKSSAARSLRSPALRVITNATNRSSYHAGSSKRHSSKTALPKQLQQQQRQRQPFSAQSQREQLKRKRQISNRKNPDHQRRNRHTHKETNKVEKCVIPKSMVARSRTRQSHKHTQPKPSGMVVKSRVRRRRDMRPVSAVTGPSSARMAHSDTMAGWFVDLGGEVKKVNHWASSRKPKDKDSNSTTACDTAPAADTEEHSKENLMQQHNLRPVSSSVAAPVQSIDTAKKKHNRMEFELSSPAYELKRAPVHHHQPLLKPSAGNLLKTLDDLLEDGPLLNFMQQRAMTVR